MFVPLGWGRIPAGQHVLEPAVELVMLNQQSARLALAWGLGTNLRHLQEKPKPFVSQTWPKNTYSSVSCSELAKSLKHILTIGHAVYGNSQIVIHASLLNAKGGNMDIISGFAAGVLW